MKDLTILHLSDLHISWDGDKRQFPLLHRNMLNDIRDQSEFYTYPVVVVVTGDIVNQGVYTDEVKGAVVSFFRKLKDILKEKFEDIFFVPGNHDQRRTSLQAELAELFKGEPTPMADTYEELLSNNSKNCREYSQLVAEIYAEFGVAERHVNTVGKTYGINLVKPKTNFANGEGEHSCCVDGKTFCFISLNTALNSIGFSDNRNLRLGSKQINSICESFHKLDPEDAEAIDLTIALAHHPINWLVGEEEDKVQNKLLSPSEWNAGLYICGHVHQRDAISWHNAHHSLTTLMTGFGWPDAGNSNAEVHLYSTYVINLDLNSIDIYVRSTNDGGVFIPDFRFFGKTMGTTQEKIVYPIDSGKTLPYIELRAAGERTNKALYLSKSFVDKQQVFFTYLCSFQNKMAYFMQYNYLDLAKKIVEERKSNGTIRWCTRAKKELTLLELFHSLIEKYGEEPRPFTFENTIKDLSGFDDSTYNEKAFEYFESFLQALCQTLIDELCIIPEARDLRDKGALRCHIRYYDEKEDRYPQICNSYGKFYLKRDGGGDAVRSPSVIPWHGSLIQASYEQRKPLLYEVNREASVAPSSGWSNFITIIPDFYQNEYRDLSGQKNRPLLTLGISCRDNKGDDLLRLYEFVRIDRIVGAILSEYVSKFQIELQRFIDYLM